MEMAGILSFIKLYLNWEGILAILNSLFIMATSVFVNWGLVPNKLAVEPTVFLVENEYQIVWETCHTAAAWVVVDNIRYTDSVAGNLLWDETIHKVSVPMEALDAAREYEIHWQSVRKDYLATDKGNDNAKTYTFRPADFSDGLQVYHLADNHSILYPAANTAAYWGEDLDLLILNGDVISDLHLQNMRNDAMELAWAVTQGERPVLYTRGNHEVKGGYATDLYRYVGCPGRDRWYFTTRLGPMWIAVYDVGESNADDDFHDSAAFRQAQTAFFDGVIANAAEEFAAPDVEYRMLVSHTPIGAGFPENQPEWFAQTNQMNLDLAIYGHQHKVQFYAAGAFKNKDVPANYPVIIGARPAHGNIGDDFIATALDFRPGEIKGWFTNQNHAVIETLPELR